MADKQVPFGGLDFNVLYRDVGGGNYAQVFALSTDAPVTVTGGVIVDTWGTLADAKVTDPNAASATMPALLRGLLSETSNAGTDGSAALAAGNTAEQLFSGATPAHGFEICNPDASEDLWISDSAVAEANGLGSFRVAANGGTYTTPPGYRPVGPVSVIAATTGHKITARKW